MDLKRLKAIATPVAPSPVAPVPIAAPVGAGSIDPIAWASPKFCPRCGAAWQADWAECIACVQRASQQETRPVVVSDAGPSVGSALRLYFLLLLASAAAIIAGAAGSAPIPTELVLITMHSIIVIICCFPLRRDIFRALAAPVHPRWFILATVMAGGTFLLATAIISALRAMTGIHALDPRGEFLIAGWTFPMIILAVAVQPAIFEELAFRGVIISSLQRALSPIETIFVSAFLFMILHLAVPSPASHTFW